MTTDGSPPAGEPPLAPGAPEAEPDPSDVPAWLQRGIALFFAWLVAVAVVVWFVIELRSLIAMVLVAFFLSLAMEPGVDRLARRGWKRGSATMLVLGSVVVLAVGVGIATGSVVVGQVSELLDSAPRYVRQLEDFVNQDLGISWNADGLVRDLREGRPIAPADDLANSAVDVTVAGLGFLLQLVTVLVFAFYMTADGPSFRRAVCSRLPRRRQEVVLDTWEIAIDKTGGYLYSRGIQAVISAAATAIVLFALGVPYALALGIWVGLVSQFIPTIGTYVAMVLPVFVALVQSPGDAIWVLVFLVIYQQFENYFLGPRITRRTMSVHPALAIGTVFAGGLLFGGVGAVLALPATAIIQALISAHTVEQQVVSAPLTREAPTVRRRRHAWRRWLEARRRRRLEDVQREK